MKYEPHLEVNSSSEDGGEQTSGRGLHCNSHQHDVDYFVDLCLNQAVVINDQTCQTLLSISINGCIVTAE